MTLLNANVYSACRITKMANQTCIFILLSTEQGKPSMEFTHLFLFIFWHMPVRAAFSNLLRLTMQKETMRESSPFPRVISLPLSICRRHSQAVWLTNTGDQTKWKGGWECPLAFCTRQGLGLRKRVVLCGYIPITGVSEKELQFLQPHLARPGHQPRYTP